MGRGQGADLQLLDPGRVPPLEGRNHVAGNPLFLFHDHHLVAGLGQRLGQGQADLAAAYHHQPFGRLDPAVGHVQRVDQQFMALDVPVGLHVGAGAGGDQADVVLVQDAAHELGVGFGVEFHLDAELLGHHLVVPHHAEQVVGAGQVVVGVGAQVAADLVALLEHGHVVAALAGRDRGLHAGRAGADDHDLLLHRRRRDLVLRLHLVAQGRVHGAGIGQVAEQARQAVQRPDAAAHFVEPVLGGLVDQFRVGQQRPADLPVVEHAVGDALVGHHRVGQPVAEGDQGLGEQFLGLGREVVPVARRDVAADRGLGRLLPAHGDRDHVDPHVDGLLHQLEALVLAVAAPAVHQLGAVQPDHQRIARRRLLDRVDQLAHEAATVQGRAAVFVGALVGEARVEVGQQIPHETGDLGAVEAGADRAFGRFRVLLDDQPDLLLVDFARRPEVRQGLRHHRRLDAVAQVDAAVAAGVQDLLDRHAAVVVDVAGDHLELRDELVVEQGDLPEIGLAFAQRVGIGALVGDDAAAGAGDDPGARQLARRDEAVAGVVVGDAAGAVLDHVLGLELAELAGLEQMLEFLLTGAGHGRLLVGFGNGRGFAVNAGSAWPQALG